MPVYDFKCSACQAVKTDVVLSIKHTDDQHPECCFGEPMDHYITKAPMVHWKDYMLPDGGFKAAHDGTVITSRAQNREYMKRNGLQDANEVYEPPTQAEQLATIKEQQESIDAITPSGEMLDIMKSDGTLDQLTER